MVFVTKVKQATIFELFGLIQICINITIIESFGYPSITVIFAQRKSTFENCIPHVSNTLLSF